MTFDAIAETLGALGKTVAARGGDHSGIAATEALLRAVQKQKPAEFFKAARKAARGGMRLPRATEVHAGVAAQSVETLIDILQASGASASALKTLRDLRDLFAELGSSSLEALVEALAAPTTAPARAAKPKAATSKTAAAKTAASKPEPSKPTAKAPRTRRAPSKS